MKKKSLLAGAAIAAAALAFSFVTPAAFADHNPTGCKTDPTEKHCVSTPTGGDSIVYAADESGTSSLASYLTSDGGNRFGTRWVDFDIATELVLWVLSEKSTSELSVLTRGDEAVTAFVPTDRAFRKLVRNLTGDKLTDERSVFQAVKGLGLETVESVLLYHIVRGGTVESAKVLSLDDATLTTMQGSDLLLNVNGTVITLIDGDDNLKNPRVVLKKIDLNEGNLQIAHGINRVLMP